MWNVATHFAAFVEFLDYIWGVEIVFNIQKHLNQFFLFVMLCLCVIPLPFVTAATGGL